MRIWPRLVRPVAEGGHCVVSPCHLVLENPANVEVLEWAEYGKHQKILRR